MRYVWEVPNILRELFDIDLCREVRRETRRRADGFLPAESPTSWLIKGR